LIDPVQIETAVIAMADDVWAWCEKVNARGQTKRGRSYISWLLILSDRCSHHKGIRLVGVTLSNFQAQSGSEAAELPLS
jgi:hypothetical protein